MAPERRETIMYFMTLARRGKWEDIKAALTLDTITLDDFTWAFRMQHIDCASTRQLASYILMASDAPFNQSQPRQAEKWMMAEQGKSTRAMLSVALYKRGFRSENVLKVFKDALADPNIGETARKYHLQAA